MADSGNHRNITLGNRAGRGFFVEPPEILKAAAAARHDNQVRARNGAANRQRIKATHTIGHFCGAALALNPHRPDDDMHRESDLAHDAGYRG